MKIINTRQEQLLKEKHEIRRYNKTLAQVNANIIETNNIKWATSIFLCVAVVFIVLSILPVETESELFKAMKHVIVTVASLLLGVPIGSRIVMPFYQQLQGIKYETESMHVAAVLNKYKPLAIARKGVNYLLVLEDRETKVVVREVIRFKYVEKTNINEIILDVDNEKLLIPYRK